MKLTLEDAINKYVHCDGFPKYQNCEHCIKRTTVIIRFIRKYPQHLDTLSITTIINLLDAMLQHHCTMMFDIELCRMVFKRIARNTLLRIGFDIDKINVADFYILRLMFDIKNGQLTTNKQVENYLYNNLKHKTLELNAYTYKFYKYSLCTDSVELAYILASNYKFNFLTNKRRKQLEQRIIDNIKNKTMAKYFCELNKTEHFIDDNLLKSIYIIYGLQE